MKESEAIRIEAANDTSDNDMRDINYLRKIERAERKESFEDNLLPLLKAKYPVQSGTNGSYEIITEKYGRLLYYPKAGSLLFTRDNNWMKKRYALNWIIKWLINN